MIVSKITDYRVPHEEKQQLIYFAQWQTSHTNDHTNFYNYLNNILKQLNKPLLRPHKFDFGFDPRDIGSINMFLKINDIEHKEIYRMINEIGELATPPFYVQPVFNMTIALMKPDIGIYAKMLFHENRVHTLTARALNLLAEAFNLQI